MEHLCSKRTKRAMAGRWQGDGRAMIKVSADRVLRAFCKIIYVQHFLAGWLYFGAVCFCAVCYFNVLIFGLAEAASVAGSTVKDHVNDAAFEVQKIIPRDWKGSRKNLDTWLYGGRAQLAPPSKIGIWPLARTILESA